MANRNEFCATCGKARKPLETPRNSWGLRLPTVAIPNGETAGRSWQMFNDLIVSACVYRNGGTSEDCHLCDDCLRIGLRAIKLAVDRTLEVIEAGTDKDAELAALTQQLAHLQWKCDRLQDSTEMESVR